MSVPLTIATESNAQMLVIFNISYDDIKNKLGKSLNFLKSKTDHFSFEWVVLTIVLPSSKA